MAQAQFKVLSKTQTVSRQDVERLELIQFGEHKLRLEIRSNAYKFQSHATVDILDKSAGIKWNQLVFRPPLAMETKEGLCYQPQAERRDFLPDMGADRLWLLDQVRMLLS